MSLTRDTREGEPVLPEMDPRMAAFATFDGQGVRTVNFEDLRQRAERCVITQPTPEGVASLLTTARRTFALSLYHYELLVVASAWSLLAVEASLREFYGATEKVPFVRLIQSAQRDGLFSEDWVDRLQAGRQLRNSLMHERTNTTFTPAMAMGIIEASHQMVSVVYPDA